MGLNDSLHFNHSMKSLTFSYRIKRNPSFRDCMARALRKNSAIPGHYLRRSQSLCDLRTLQYPFYHHQLLQQQNISSSSVFPPEWRHIPPSSPRLEGDRFFCSLENSYQSCPDLLEMQALQNMHPILHEALRCDELYFP